MPVPASQVSATTPLERFVFAATEADLASARHWAEALGVPLAYLYADNADLAEVILAFGLLPETEQRRLAAELKERLSPPAARVRAARSACAKRRTA